MKDDDLYDQAITEVRERRVVQAIWARAMAESDGDAKKTIARYIALRVEDLQGARAQEKIQATKDIAATVAKKGWKWTKVGIVVLFVLVAGAIGKVVGKLVADKTFQSTASLSDALDATVRELAPKTPMMLDEITRIDWVTRSGEHELTYDYTLIKVDPTRIQAGILRELLALTIAPPSCVAVQKILSLGGTVVYRYSTEGRHLASIKLSKSVCNRLPLAMKDPSITIAPGVLDLDYDPIFDYDPNWKPDGQEQGKSAKSESDPRYRKPNYFDQFDEPTHGKPINWDDYKVVEPAPKR